MRLLWTSAIFLAGFAALAYGEPTWQVANPRPLPGMITSLKIAATDTIYAANDAAMVVRSVDNGVHWETLTLPREVDGKILLDFVNGRYGFVVAISNSSTPFGALVFRTVNGGTNWTEWEVGNDEEMFGASTLTMKNETVLIGGITPGIANQAVVYRLVNDEWLISHSPGDLARSVNDIYLFNSTIGFLVGDNGYFANTNDGGRTWQQVASGLNTNLLAVCFTSPTTGWAGGGTFNRGEIFKTTNGGAEWQAIDGLDVASKIVDLMPYAGSGISAISKGGGDPDVANLLLASNGRDWSTIGSWAQQVITVLSTRAEEIFLAGEIGFIARSNGGQEPVEISSRVSTNDLLSISFANGASGWAVGNHSTVLKSSDGGFQWESIDNFPLYEPASVVALTPWRAIVSCRGGINLVTRDGGGTWREFSLSAETITGLEKYGNSIYGISGSSVVVSHDAGQNWITSSVREGATLLSISPISESVAYVTVLRDSTFITNDGGETWRPSILIPPSTRCLYFQGNNNAWAATETVNGTNIWSTSNSWRNKTREHSLNFDVINLKYISESEGFALGDGGQFRLLQHGNAGSASTGLQASSIIHNIECLPGWLWVCGDGGLLARYGENWLNVRDAEKATTPITPDFVRFWPNPTNGWINIEMKSINNGGVQVIGIDGREVFPMAGISRNGITGFDLSRLSGGVYYLRNPSGSVASSPIILLK